MSDPPSDNPPSPLVPVCDEVTGRTVAHYDPKTQRLRVKVWRSRRVWINIRRLLDTQETVR